MEDVLEVYARPYNAKFPVVCMDESSVQLIGEVHEPIPVAPGHPVLMDDEYVRKGVASIFMEVEPLGGKRKVKITERRTRIEWAHFIKEMLEDRYADAEKVVLVMDNLNTHNTTSLYTAFPAEEARSLAVVVLFILPSFVLFKTRKIFCFCLIILPEQIFIKIDLSDNGPAKQMALLRWLPCCSGGFFGALPQTPRFFKA